MEKWKNLGKTLNKVQQKAILGGGFSVGPCEEDSDCPISCAFAQPVCSNGICMT